MSREYLWPLSIHFCNWVRPLDELMWRMPFVSFNCRKTAWANSPCAPVQVGTCTVLVVGESYPGTVSAPAASSDFLYLQDSHGTHSFTATFTVFTLGAGLLAISQYSEGPATGQLDTGFSWFPCVYKRMLRWFPKFQVATTCFSCSPPDLNLLVTSFIFCIHVK